MKYLVNWNERPQGSAIEYENAQKRILKIFLHWEIPSEVKVHAFVVRVGEWGGSMLFEADDALIMHKMCSIFPAFQFESIRSSTFRTRSASRWKLSNGGMNFLHERP